ncbi:MAG TPA: sigma-70 family RNA polymerase sigma factor [Longimicrobiales bacterium]|nr:sigma-70 family RNA polymerase sigma factor [Longimicrobiales bacterium]
MDSYARQLRTPEERVGMLPNASLPPPHASAAESEDALLFSALRDGNEKAFARAADQYFSGMLRLALTHVDSRATAEEVIQETWMAAIRGIDRFQGRSSVKTWLFHILRNLARTRGSRDSRMRTFSDLRGAPFTESDVDPVEMVVDARAANGGHELQAMWVRSTDPEQQLLARELADHIARALAALPPRQREVITLRDVEGWSAEDVCNALGLSQTNQRVILHRARDRVRNELQDYLAKNNGCGDDEEPEVR